MMTMSNNKQIEKPLELPHQETIVGTNTLQTKPFDNQKIEIMSNNKPLIAAILAMIGFYLLTAFCTWDLNAKNWDISTRILYVWFATLFSLIAYFAIKLVKL